MSLFIALLYVNEVTGPEVALKWTGKTWNELADKILRRLMVEEGCQVVRIEENGSIWAVQA